MSSQLRAMDLIEVREAASATWDCTLARMVASVVYPGGAAKRGSTFRQRS